MKEEITSGNPLADTFMIKDITDDYLGWALVTYFEKKGILNRSEFMETLSQELSWILKAKQQAIDDLE